MTVGRRDVEDDKTLVTELGRLLHVVKTNEKQRKVIVRNKHKQKTASVDATQAAPKTAGDKRRRSRRAGQNAGSIWITLTPSFAAVTRQDTGNKKLSAAEYRAVLSAKKSEAAIAAARDYIASAMSQAEEAGLAERGVPTSIEGANYLAEQFAHAKNLARVAPVGHHLAQLVVSTSGQSTAVSPLPMSGSSFQSSLSAAMDHVLRERTLLQCAAAVVRDEDGTVLETAPVVEPPTLSVEDDARALAVQQRFLIGDATEADGDVLPTKCIVKLKGVSKKVTSILRTQKAASNFKQNFTQLLKKEVSSLLARDAASLTSPAAGKTKAPSSTTAHKAPSPSAKKSGKRK